MCVNKPFPDSVAMEGTPRYNKRSLTGIKPVKDRRQRMSFESTNPMQDALVANTQYTIDERHFWAQVCNADVSIVSPMENECNDH